MFPKYRYRVLNNNDRRTVGSSLVSMGKEIVLFDRITEELETLTQNEKFVFLLGLSQSLGLFRLYFFTSSSEDKILLAGVSPET